MGLSCCNNLAIYQHVLVVVRVQDRLHRWRIIVLNYTLLIDFKGGVLFTLLSCTVSSFAKRGVLALDFDGFPRKMMMCVKIL